VYLIACANLTSLFLARGTTRRRELAVRRSIGATSAQLFRMFLAESIVLALPGAALGLVVARWLVVFVQGSAPLDVPRLVSVEQGSLIVGLGVALLGALACGLLGLAGVVTTDGYADANELGPRAGTLSKRTRRAHRALLGIEAACASVVLVATVLLGASLARLLAVDPGYTSQGVVVLRLYIPGDDDDTDARRWRLTQELLRELRVLPSVVSAGAGTMFPFDSGNAMAGFPLPGQYRVALPPDVTPRSAFARTYSVTPGYAEALRLRVLNGRLLTERDRTADVERWVVSKEFARLYLPANPVGRRFPWTVADRDVDLEIVGVVDDVLKDGLDRSAQPEVYDLMRDGRAGDIKLLIRAAARADALVGSVRALVSRLAPDAAIDVTALDELKAHSVSGPRFLIVVVGVFAALALVLACGGVYAVTTFSVSQRRRELAIRGALGAPAASLAWLVMRQALEPAAAGLCAGLACATTLARLGQDHLFRTSPLEPFAFGATAVSVASVTLLAATIPALSAARSEPTLALRSE
jgi:predicted permease